MGDYVESEEMTEDVFMFGQSPSFSELVERVKLNLRAVRALSYT